MSMRRDKSVEAELLTVVTPSGALLGYLARSGATVHLDNIGARGYMTGRRKSCNRPAVRSAHAIAARKSGSRNRTSF